MNNKYGYRLVDILKRGRGHGKPPPRRRFGARKRSKRIAEMKAGGEILSRSVSILQLLEIAQPRITSHR